MTKFINRFVENFKLYGHHLVIGISIVSMALLVAWWWNYINFSIQHHHNLHIRSLESQLKFLALKSGLNTRQPPTTGVHKEDNQFEITLSHRIQCPYKECLTPCWPKFSIKIRDAILKEHLEDFKRKKRLVLGESILLILIILTCTMILYRCIRLEQRSALEIEEFWGRITHEIKTPITGIKAFLESIKNQSIDPCKIPFFVDMALKQIENQEQLAENILVGYGLSSNYRKLKPILKDLNLEEFINGYFHQHALLLTGAKLTIDVRRDPDSHAPIRGQADPNMLKIILDNITDNALKYCLTELKLTVGIFNQNKNAVISIRDNGPGFSKKFIPRIFKAYKHLNDKLPGKTHGSGIGLYISRKLVEKMSGQLEALSDGEGRGAEFRIYLTRSKTSNG
ncbi:MAG: sensor histidine kinase [Candidatus Omnitrophota bacterium]